MLNKFYDMLQNNIPFAYVRFGDGEIAAMQRENFRYAERRGGAPVNKELRSKLIEAFKFEAENYYKGIMQPDMYSDLWKWIKEQDYWNPDYKYLTEAWIIHNKGLIDFYENFHKYTSNRDIIWISGHDQDANKLEALGISVKFHFKIQGQFSWDSYDRAKDLISFIKPNDVVCMSCGPLSRVLTYEWFVVCSELTILDVGSIFDIFTRGKSERYHISTLIGTKYNNFLN